MVCKTPVIREFQLNAAIAKINQPQAIKEMDVSFKQSVDNAPAIDIKPENSNL